MNEIKTMTLADKHGYKKTFDSFRDQEAQKQIAALKQSGTSSGSGTPSVNGVDQTTICTFLDAYAAWCNGEKFPIAFYGDSTFFGTNTSGAGHTFCDILQKQLTRECGGNPTIYRVAVAGTTLSQGVSSFDGNFGVNGTYADTKMLGIGYGINDRLRYATYKEYKDGVYSFVEAIIKKCFDRGIQPFLVTSQATLECGVMTQYANQYPLRYSNAMNVCANGAKKELAKKYNIPLLDLNAFTELYLVNSTVPANTIISERLHFGDVGHIYEAGYFFREIVSRVIEVGGKDQYVINYANQNLKDAVPEEKLSYGIADFKLGVNYSKGNTADTKIMDVYLFVKDYPASITAHKNDGGATYIAVNGQPYPMGENELQLGILDLGLHHLEVFTGENEFVNFNGFKINSLDTLENIISPDDGSDVVIIPPDDNEGDGNESGGDNGGNESGGDHEGDGEVIDGGLLLDATQVTATVNASHSSSPMVFVPNYNESNKTTAISGKTITKIILPDVGQTGTLTIGKVDLNEVGTGNMTLLDTRICQVNSLTNAEIVLKNFVLGEHEAITFGNTGDTCTTKFFAGNTVEAQKLMANEAFKKGTATQIGFSCQVYGY